MDALLHGLLLALLLVVGAGLIAVTWESLLRGLISHRLRRHRETTGVHLTLAFFGPRNDTPVLSRFGAERSGHARLAAAEAEARLERLFAFYQRTVPGWCRSHLHP